MRARDFRKQAWGAISGKWKMLALIALVYALITSASNVIPAIGMLAIIGPLEVSWCLIALSVLRGGEARLEGLFDGFKRFVPAFLLYLVNSLVVALWSLLFVIPGIIKALGFAMSPYILAENPEMSWSECRAKSVSMMKGNKWRLFCLYFSFFGWILLCMLTLGILSFWVIPYMEVTEAAFYEDLKAQAE